MQLRIHKFSLNEFFILFTFPLRLTKKKIPPDFFVIGWSWIIKGNLTAPHPPVNLFKQRIYENIPQLPKQKNIENINSDLINPSHFIAIIILIFNYFIYICHAMSFGLTIVESWQFLPIMHSMFWNKHTNDYQFSFCMDNVDLDTSIDTLSKIETMSVKATNICRYNNLHNLFLILDRYVSNGNFLDIRNCGKRTSEELVRISQKYILLYPFQKVVNHDLPDSELLLPQDENQLSQLQKAILTNFIHIKIRPLSNRFKNALKKYLKADFSFDTFDRLIRSDPKLKMDHIEGMGKRSFVELKYLMHAINDYVDIITPYNDTELLRELYVTYLQRFFQIEEEGLRLITSEYDFSLGIPVFKTIFFLAKFKKIFTDTEKSLFFSDSYRYIDFSVDNHYVEFAELNRTQERIHQVSLVLPSKLHDNVKKIFKEDFHSYMLNTYSCVQHADFIHVDRDLLLRIWTTENASFTQQFITFILSALYEETHFLVGDVDWFYPHYRKHYYFEWENFYLINRRLGNIFNFREFVQSLFNILSKEKRKHLDFDKNLDYHSFLSQFFYSNDYSEMDTIAPICKTIIHTEFPEVTIFNNRIIFDSSPASTTSSQTE